MTAAAEHHPDTDLVISRVLAAPRAAVWRAWTEPDLLRQWWCPRPWTTEVRAFELRAGGAFHTFMRPRGRQMLGGGWRPQTPWLGFTAIITLEDEGQGCRYTAQVMHPDKTVRDQHEQMGFFEGWNMAIDQLEALAAGL